MNKCKLLGVILSVVTVLGLTGCTTSTTQQTTTQPKVNVVQEQKKLEVIDYLNNVKYYGDGIIKMKENPEEMKNENIAIGGNIIKIENDEKTGIQKVYLELADFVGLFNNISREIQGKPVTKISFTKCIINYDPKDFNGVRVVKNKHHSGEFVVKYESINKDEVPVLRALSKNLEVGLIEGASAIYQLYKEKGLEKPQLRLLDKTKFTGKKARFNDNTEFIFQDVKSKKYLFTEMRNFDIEYVGMNEADKPFVPGVIIREVTEAVDDFVVDNNNKDRIYKMYPMYMLRCAKISENRLKACDEIFSYNLQK